MVFYLENRALLIYTYLQITHFLRFQNVSADSAVSVAFTWSKKPTVSLHNEQILFLNHTESCLKVLVFKIKIDHASLRLLQIHHTT